MLATEISPYIFNQPNQLDFEIDSLISEPFILVYKTKPDIDKGIPGEERILRFPEGSFSLEPNLSASFHSLCDALGIQAPCNRDNWPYFVRTCLYTADGKPHFEKEVIQVLFPNGGLEASKANEFMSSAVAPENPDQCCEIEGVCGGRKVSVHLHGPYQGDNKTRLTLLALVGYEPAQVLLSKLVEKQPELRGKPLKQTILTVVSTIVERKKEQAVKHGDHEHGHDHHDYHKDRTDYKPISATPKPLERFVLTEKIPSKELGFWGQSLKTVTDAAVSLVLMQEQMDQKTKKELENTVTYRLGFSPDPRHLLPEEVALNRACDDAITEHLQTKKDLIGNLAPEQLTQALLLMRSVRFGEEEMHHLAERLNTINPDSLQQTGSISELQPTLNYTLKFGGQEVDFSYSQVLQIVALSMSLRSQKEPNTFTLEEQKIMRLSTMFNEFGFTLSNFRSDANPYIQEHPYLLKPGQPLQQFEQAAMRNNPNALQAFKGLDAHSRVKDMMGLHGTIKIENGKIVQDLCPDHTQQVTNQLQQVEQITQQLQQQFMQAKMEMPIPPMQQPPVPPLYPPPYLYGAPHPNHLGGLPRQYNPHIGIPYKMPMGGFFSPSPISGGRNENPGLSSFGRSEPKDFHSPSSSSKLENNNRRESPPQPSKPKPVDFSSPRPTTVECPHRPSTEEVVHKVLVQEVSSGGKSPVVLESIPRNKGEAIGRVFKKSNGDFKTQPSLTLVRKVPTGGMKKSLLRSVPTTKTPKQVAGKDIFMKKVETGEQPASVVRNTSLTEISNNTKETINIQDGEDIPLNATDIRQVATGGTDSSTNTSESTSSAYIDAESSNINVSPIVAKPTIPELQPVITTRSNKPNVTSIVTSIQSDNSDRQFISIDSIDVNQAAKPNTPRFTTSLIDMGSRSPQLIIRDNSVIRSVSDPIKVSSVTIGTDLSKAFEKVQEQKQRETEESTQSVQAQRSEQVHLSTKQGASVTTQIARQQQQEQVATAIGGMKQEKKQQKVAQKVEAGESFGTSATNETAEQSASITSLASIQEVKGKTETTQANTAPVIQTRQTRGSSSNLTEAARITEVETPRGKVRVIEGGRAISVSANATHGTQAASKSSDEEVVVATVKGTDEQQEENGASDIQTVTPKKTSAIVASTNNVVRVKQTRQTAAESLALKIDNEYLDFTNPHGIRDAFLKALAQA